MDQIWSTWWSWIVLGLALGMVEVIVPGYIFVGFAVGAALTGLVVLVGIPAGLPMLLAIFAVLSLISWLVIRRLLGTRDGQVKIWDRDINDNP
ncbi:hypothetical protein M3484_13910 [Pseudomonas sp. GX19020]|uniref:NfeD family protein n=1 Tax=Pseudomonadota TaxID=1224 RepID=UPI000896E15C|nr:MULTISPECIES: hypothetical protein [Pseudomonadota]MBJ2153908.1 hypothetical protein [Paracoccus sp. IB05]MCL4067668.1 hypothetical protein [Pseudomonas sp. GX19020]SEC50859.1 hypothetical protein SAMN05519105_2717 [Rhodobacter sp. 24-YEA-8]